MSYYLGYDITKRHLQKLLDFKKTFCADEIEIEAKTSFIRRKLQNIDKALFAK